MMSAERQSATPNAPKSPLPSRLDGRPRRCASKADVRDTQARKWLARAHRSFRSWARVAQVVGLTSKGQAQHIAEGRAPVPSSLLMALAELQAYRQAARWLAARQITE